MIFKDNRYKSVTSVSLVMRGNQYFFMCDCEDIERWVLSLLVNAVVSRKCVTLYTGVGNSISWPKRGFIHMCLVDKKNSAENICYFGRERFSLVQNSLLIKKKFNRNNVSSRMRTFQFLSWLLLTSWIEHPVLCTDPVSLQGLVISWFF